MYPFRKACYIYLVHCVIITLKNTIQHFAKVKNVTPLIHTCNRNHSIQVGLINSTPVLYILQYAIEAAASQIQ